ncbi:MAG: hypothetical protein ACM3L6_06715 [Deltaproteobacteria bacterium]
MKKRIWGVVVIGLLAAAVLTPYLAAQTAPSLPLKTAVDNAEKALADKGVAIDQYFLYSVMLHNDSSGDYWKCTYRPMSGNDRGGYGQIYVKVYMSGKVDVEMPELPVRYR